MDSNDFTAIASLILFVYLLKSLIKKEEDIPYWPILLQYISGVGVGLTFLTTATFLAPTQVSLGNSYWLFFSGNMFFLHFVTPVLSIATFVTVNEKYPFKLRENLLGLIPVFLYSIVYIINVVFLKSWKDFYGFTFGGHVKSIRQQKPKLLAFLGNPLTVSAN